jgi:NAD-dependent SIR2 family protein deacetylase
MAHYRCPSCNDVVDLDGLARVTWCNGCGQPLTLLDLLPIRPGITSTEPPQPEEADTTAIA